MSLKRQVSWALWLYCLSQSTFALEQDKMETLHVAADSAELDQQTHRGFYLGHVRLDQGTTHLRAATAITEGDEHNKLTKAIAKGDQRTQAHFWTLTSPEKPTLHAYGDAIYYYPLRHLIELIGNARIEQGKNSLSATKIIYDTEKQHLVTAPSNRQKRTRIVLYPEKKYE